MDGVAIRESFLRFFEERDHTRVKSASLIPAPESGLLLTNAGMNQFIPYFLGIADPPFVRATTAQKCFRTNDIENVGRTARHLTLFEMLGNFSFGDYFKRESCTWGFEFLTEVLGVDPDLLWVSVFESDDEAAQIWQDIGLPPERIVRRGKEANFWSTHAAGPAGPSSEIFFDRGPQFGPDGGPAVDEERYMEIWNHVFMQNEVDEHDHVLGDLPRKNIDTGSSLERLATVLNGLGSVYETDLLRPLVEVAESRSGRTYGRDETTDRSLRIVAEHGRATTFLIADGVQPSNEGRGYVLRRMLRRLVDHARRLGIEGSVTEPLVETTVEILGEAYPELRENRAFAIQVAGSEEERFSGTLRQGRELLAQALEGSGQGSQLSGDDAFKLHDTFGFPKELTIEIADDAGVQVDLERFDELMQAQRTRAKENVKKGSMDDAVAGVVTRVGPTEFVGYRELETDSEIAALLAGGGETEVASEGEQVRLLLPRSPFYAESGGQVGDVGTIRASGGLVRVTDAQWAPGEAIVHSGVVESGEIRAGEEAAASVDPLRRASTARSHTATHVLHWTLKHLLGEHARQAGSLVAPGRLRFDFPHHAAVSRDQLEEAEEEVNRRLAEDESVRIFETTFDEAKRLGATALFGEKYGDLVRVVEIGEYSRELCGGTHVHRTGNVAIVRILGESSIGAGMRRVEAIVGPDAIREINLERRLLEEVAHTLRAGDVRSSPERAAQVMSELKRLQNELGSLAKEQSRGLAEHIAARATDVGGARLVVELVPDQQADALRELAQISANKLEGTGGAAVVLGSRDGGKALLVAAASNALVGRGVRAPELLEVAAKQVHGGAGGKPILAFAGGKNGEAVEAALAGIPARLEELLAAGG
ncbi:MAG: alanine--tRNA ligase [Actinomycetota bacterium]